MANVQFDSKTFRRYCCNLGIKNRYSTPTYLQGNGQAEAVNKVIVSGLKNKTRQRKREMGRRIATRPLDLLDYTS